MNWQLAAILLFAAAVAVYASRHLPGPIEQLKRELND